MEYNYNYNKKELLIVLGNNIKRTRVRRHIGIKELANRAKYDRSKLSYLEIGEQNVKFKTVLKLSRVLNVPLPELLSRTYDPLVYDMQEREDNYIEEDYLKVFVENFSRQLLAQRLEQKDVYVRTGISEQTISKIISRKSNNPKIETLGALAHAIGIDIRRLFLREE